MPACKRCVLCDLDGRDGGIRTRDPLNPIQVRYQTAPRPDRRRAFEQGRLCMSNGERRDEGRFLVAALLGMTGALRSWRGLTRQIPRRRAPRNDIERETAGLESEW